MITLYYYKHCSIKYYFNDVISAAVRQVAALLVLATICRRPVTLTFDLLTLKSVWESPVTWGTPVQSFVFLGLLVFELEPMYATSDGETDGQTDGRRTPITALCPLGGGIIITTTTMFMVLSSWQSHCESSPGSFDECTNVTAHPSTASVPTPYYLLWHYNCLWSLNG